MKLFPYWPLENKFQGPFISSLITSNFRLLFYINDLRYHLKSFEFYLMREIFLQFLFILYNLKEKRTTKCWCLYYRFYVL